MIEWNFGRLGGCRRVCRRLIGRKRVQTEKWGSSEGLTSLYTRALMHLSAVGYSVSNTQFRVFVWASIIEGLLEMRPDRKSVFLIISPSILTQHHVIITNPPIRHTLTRLSLCS